MYPNICCNLGKIFFFVVEECISCMFSIEYEKLISYLTVINVRKVWQWNLGGKNSAIWHTVYTYTYINLPTKKKPSQKKKTTKKTFTLNLNTLLNITEFWTQHADSKWQFINTIQFWYFLHSLTPSLLSLLNTQYKNKKRLFNKKVE